MELPSILTFFCIIFVTIYAFLQYRFAYWKRRNIPYIKPHPIYGNAKGVEKTIHHTKFWIDIYQKLKSKGPIVGIFVYHIPIAVVTDLDLVKRILVKDFNIFTNRGHYFNQKYDPISAHLFNIEGDYWRSIRNKLTPAFTSGKLKLMYSTVSQLTDKFLKLIESSSENGKSLDIRDAGARFVSDALGLTGFGIDCHSMTSENAEFHEIALYTTGNIRFMSKTFVEYYRDFFNFIRFTNLTKRTRNFYTGIIENVIKYRKQNLVDRNDFLAFMFNIKDSSQSLSKSEIIANSAVFLVAGHEAVSLALSHCLYELSLRSDLREKARNSIYDALAKYNNEFCCDALYDMNYLEQCIFETLRKYFISVAVRRVASEDYKVPNTNIVIEKGTHVQIPVYAIHNDPEIYPEPDKWDPDRFSPEEVEKRHKFAFLGFGEGAKLCIGKRLSILIMKTFLAQFLTTYDFTLDRDKTSVPLKNCVKRMFFTPKEGIHIKIKKLSK